MACGFSLRDCDLPRFHAYLDEALAEATGLPAAPDLQLDATVTVAGATAELADQIDRLGPFGQGNAEPVLLIANARVAHAERIGRDAATIRAQLTDATGARLKSMLFRAAEGPLAQAMTARDNAPLHLAGHLRADRWNGRVTPCFTILDAASAA
jgi:single-stranded-DNA-specific exonuclease